MVGEEARNMKLSTISKQIIGKDYELGKCDCFSIVRDYLLQKGVPLPKTYKGIDIISGYAELWEKNPDEAKDLMIKGFAQYLEEIPVYKMKAGDILHLQYGDKHFCGIHGGHGHVIGASPDYGVALFKIADYEVMGVYRWHSQPL